MKEINYNEFHTRKLLKIGNSEFTRVEVSDYKKKYKEHTYKSTRVNIMDVNLATIKKTSRNHSDFKVIELTGKTNKGVNITIKLFS